MDRSILSCCARLTDWLEADVTTNSILALVSLHWGALSEPCEYGSAFDFAFNGSRSADRSSPRYSVKESSTKNIAALLSASAIVHISRTGVGSQNER